MTTGDEDGLLLTLEKDLGGTLEFNTQVGQYTVELSQLEQKPVRYTAGGVEQQVLFERAPNTDNMKRDVAWHAEVDVPSQEAVNGVVPLHLRIVQIDGHRAWTSPWFVQV
jgi:hypothetical protein